MSDTNTSRPVRKRRRLRRGLRLWIAVAVLVLLIPLLIWGASKMIHPLTLQSDVYTVQMHEDFDPYENLQSVFLGSRDDVRFEGSVNTNVSEPYATEVAYIYNGIRQPFTVEVTDSVAPELTLKDVRTDLSQSLVAEDFVETVSDPSGYSLRLDCPDDIAQPGKHTVTVTARDNFGNETAKTAVLERIEDKTAPVLDGFEDSMTMLQGDSYLQKPYAASDDVDPAPMVRVDIGALNSQEPGTYPVNYIVRDRSGNEQTYTQNVEVQPNPNFGKKMVYLTFDDGPSANTRRVLDILSQYGVHATFFVTGTNPEYNEVMKEIVDQGSTVALHTYSHDYASVYKDDAAYFDDLQKISDLVEQETGIRSQVIRFPGGSSNSISSAYNQGIMSRLVSEVQARGYQYFDWNTDSTDASGNDVPVETLVENATLGIGMDDVCILMHDTGAKNTTVDALPKIIQAYKDADYAFGVLTPTSPPVHHGVNN